MYRKNRIKTYDSNYPRHCFIHIFTYISNWSNGFCCRPKLILSSIRTWNISVELSRSVQHNKTTNKRANEQADEQMRKKERKSRKQCKKISCTKMANINVHFAFRFTIFMVMWCGNVDMNLSRRFGVFDAPRAHPTDRPTHRSTVHACMHANGWHHFVSYFYLV